MTYSELLGADGGRPRQAAPAADPRAAPDPAAVVALDRARHARRRRRGAPLIESLASETIVTDPEPAKLFDVRPMGSLEALRLARAEEESG